jgi:hypothetical protein
MPWNGNIVRSRVAAHDATIDDWKPDEQPYGPV